MATTRKYSLQHIGRCQVVNSKVYAASSLVMEFWLYSFPFVRYDMTTYEQYVPLAAVNQELSIFITRATRILQAGSVDDYQNEDDVENRLFL